MHAEHVAGKPDQFTLETGASAPRSISVIAADVRRNRRTKDGRPNINYAAAPYLDAMSSLDVITDKYYLDDAKSIILYFLGNAQSWRGTEARRIKAELKALTK